MDEDNFLLLSGIQHFKFCKRQWALIHIEQQWHENEYTVEGEMFHATADNPTKIEKRNNVISLRAMRVQSYKLGITGICDVVEFYQSESGINMHGWDGLWRVYPIEYKVGSPKIHNADELQLCAEAMCLEEMLCCDIPEGSIYYGEIRRRKQIIFTPELRDEVIESFKEMNSYFEKGWTPKVKPFKGCKLCSLRDICLPKISKVKKASAYIKETLEEENG